MLTYLHVQNIALIEELEIDFDKGLNILTGETGAGKSIILGSIHYVLGAKVKKDFIRTGTDYGIVECVFDLKESKSELEKVREICLENGINMEDEEIILSRKTPLNGRSVFRINGNVVKQSTINELSSYLIDIHSQHEHQSLLNRNRQLELLDKFIGSKVADLLDEYLASFKALNKLKKSVNEQYLDDEKRRREIAFLEFEINEIIDSNLVLGEDELLQKEYDTLSHRKEIINYLSQLENDLNNEPDISDIISRHVSNMNKALKYDDSLQSIVDSLMQVEDMLSMVNREVLSMIDEDSSYEERLYIIEHRLDDINQLKVKYGNSIEDILDYCTQKQEEHDYLVNYEKELINTNELIKKLTKQVKEVAEHIHNLRIKGAKVLSIKITEALQSLNLEHAKFEVSIIELDKMNQTGMTAVDFMITTNKGEILKSVKEVASGGELSRVMLAIKSILASVDGVDSLVFDEIDTGISGLTAQKVAERMKLLATERQIICITHLPQIAAMNNQHFKIYKESNKEKTITYMKHLNEEESIEELARMLSGAIVSETVLANAKEMREFAK